MTLSLLFHSSSANQRTFSIVQLKKRPDSAKKCVPDIQNTLVAKRSKSMSILIEKKSRSNVLTTNKCKNKQNFCKVLKSYFCLYLSLSHFFFTDWLEDQLKLHSFSTKNCDNIYSSFNDVCQTTRSTSNSEYRSRSNRATHTRAKSTYKDNFLDDAQFMD